MLTTIIAAVVSGALGIAIGSLAGAGAMRDRAASECLERAEIAGLEERKAIRVCVREGRLIAREARRAARRGRL